MRLTRTAELGVVGALILLTVVSPGLGPVRELLQSRLGVAAGLLTVYWSAKTVGGPVALVLGLVLARASMSAREHMNTNCECADPTYTYDTGKKLCIKKEGDKEKTSSPICCGVGQIWNSLQAKCTSSPTRVGASVSA